MRRRSGAGGEPIKTRRRKAMTLKRGIAPKTVRRRSSSATGQETKVTQLARERDEAVEQHTATAEILRVISSSPGDLLPVFEAILESATRICEAKFGNLWLREGNKFRIVAMHGESPEYREYLFAEPLVALAAQDAVSRVVSHGEVVQIDDISKAPTYGMRMRIATIKIAKARTLACVPMLKDNDRECESSGSDECPCGHRPKDVADRGYYSSEEILTCDKAGINSNASQTDRI